MKIFSNKWIQVRQEFENLGTAWKIYAINQYIKTQLEENLKYKNLIWDVFSYENGSFTVKKPWESKILSNHFKWIPIVPWIMMKLLLLSLIKNKELNKNGSKFCKTIFYKSWVPWSKIYIWEDLRSLVDENWDKYISIEYIDKLDWVEDSEYKMWFKRIKKQPIKNFKKSPKKDIDKSLLQIKKFRFAHNSWFIEQKEENDVNVWDMFSWQYKISPSDICFFNAHRNTEEIYHWFFEEITAQIWSLAMWKILWDVNDSKSKILTFWESILKFDSRKIKERLSVNSVINITWIIISKDRRYITFIYIWKNEKWENIFRWEISWNIISSKILSKMSK